MLLCLQLQLLYTFQALRYSHQQVVCRSVEEIVSYKKTLNDRFYEVTRGIDGTEAQAHPAGQYLRTLPTFVTVLPAAPATILITESEVRMTDAKLVELKSQIVTEQEVKTTEERYIEIENEFQILTPVVETSVIQVAVKSIQPVDQSVRVSTERDILVTSTVDKIIDITDTVVSIDLELDHQIILDPVDEFEVEKEIVIIPPTTVVDGSQSASSTSSVTEIVATISNISSDSARIQSVDRLSEVGITINIVPGFKLETEITKFEGLKDERTFSTVAGTTESVANISVAPTQSAMGALTTLTVSETIVNLNELADVDFPRGRDGGVLGGSSESGPRQLVSRIDLYQQAEVRTHSFIETNVDLSVGSISSTYNVAADLPVVGGRSKPADVMLVRQTGVIDYFEELVVLETSIKTRN